MDTTYIVALLVGLLVLVAVIGFGLYLHKKQLNTAFENAQNESKLVLEEARRDADQIVRDSIKEAKEESRKRKQSFDEETKHRRSELAKLENKIKAREQNLEKKLDLLSKKEAEIDKAKEAAEAEEQRFKRLTVECEKNLEQSRRTLQNIAGMSAEEAKRELVKTLEEEAQREAEERVRMIEKSAREEAEERARSMVSLAVQRIAGEHVNESTVSVVSLPSDEMKGRIIGREGRNIRAIEQATGVDLIIDDTPEAVILSCFNPMRREIAKVSMDRLIADGRIHPARIEETVKRVTEEFDQILTENGEQACFETGITDLHPELVRMLGRLRYRSVGQQTVLQHSVEVSHICGIMASEMGINVKIAKRCGLLHDIGKAADQQAEGHHATVGAEIVRKYDENETVCRAIIDHHATDVTHLSPHGVVLHAANSLSSHRPGARKELLDSYVKRLEDMETLIHGFHGIEEAFVMQAGREIRAMVKPTGVSDKEIVSLSQDVVAKLRKELTFPGQIRVTVARESRYSDVAQ